MASRVVVLSVAIALHTIFKSDAVENWLQGSKFSIYKASCHKDSVMLNLDIKGYTVFKQNKCRRLSIVFDEYKDMSNWICTLMSTTLGWKE